MCLREDNLPIGYVHVSAEDGHDLGYGLRSDCWGQGIATEAARAVLEQSEGEDIELVLAPPDLWNRSQESGKSRAQLFSEAGLNLTMSSRDFAAGCAAIKEWLSLDSEGKPYMQFYRCKNLVDCMAKIQKDERNPNVYAKEPHSLTHAVDSLSLIHI